MIDTLTDLEKRVLNAIADSDVPVPMFKLVELVWPDADLQPDYAHDTVRVIVLRIRRKHVRLYSSRGFGYSLCPLI